MKLPIKILRILEVVLTSVVLVLVVVVQAEGEEEEVLEVVEVDGEKENWILIGEIKNVTNIYIKDFKMK